MAETADTIASVRSLRARGFSEDAIGAMLKIPASNVIDMLEGIYSRKVDKNRTILEAIDSCKEIEKDLTQLINDEKEAAGGADRKLLLDILKTKVTIQDKKSDLISKIKDIDKEPKKEGQSTMNNW